MVCVDGWFCIIVIMFVDCFIVVIVVYDEV